MYRGARETQERQPKKLEKKFEKPLDKLQTLWYNKYEQREGHPTNQKGITTMKKISLEAIRDYLTEQNALTEIRDEIVAELAKGAEKAEANRTLYADAHDVIVGVMANLTAPATIADIYEEAKNDLPEGMSKGKVQYAITRLWADEMVKTEGKVNTYAFKA